jgi:molybdopterin converting factor subunit 1
MLEAGGGPDGHVKVKVLYFAQAREFAGIKEEELMLATPASVKHLFARLLNAHPDLQRIGDVIRTLVNGRLVPDDAQLNDGDRVAIVPPVAGG